MAEKTVKWQGSITARSWITNNIPRLGNFHLLWQTAVKSDVQSNCLTIWHFPFLVAEKTGKWRGLIPCQITDYQPLPMVRCFPSSVFASCLSLKEHQGASCHDRATASSRVIRVTNPWLLHLYTCVLTA
jgi:hypothetical protein